MATYTKETALYDTGAISDGISEAGETATNYITQIDSNGIYVSPSSQSPTSGSEGNSIRIDGDGMTVYKGGVSVASYGDTARVGKTGGSHIDIDSDSISMVRATAFSTYPVFLVDWSDEFTCVIGAGNGIVRIRNTNSDARHDIYTHNADVGVDGNMFARNFKSGRTATITVPANSYKDYDVAFNESFDDTPNVVCSIYSTSTAGAIGSLVASAISVTENGFTVRVFNAGSSQRTPAVDWIAVLTQDPVYIV